MVAVVVLMFWALHTVVVTGSLVLYTHYGELLRGRPVGALRAPLSDLIQDATPSLSASLPDRAAVLVIVDPEELNGFAYFWLTYWLYPRHIDETADLSNATATGDDAIIYFAPAGAPELATPDHFRIVSDKPGAGGGRVVIFVRDSTGP